MSFSIFSQTKNTFSGMHSDETVLLLVRRHWFVPTVQLFGIVIAGIIPLALVLAGSQYLTEQNLWGIAFFLGSLYALFLWYSAFYILMIYDLNTWIVTNHRIIDTRQIGFFDRNVAEVPLSRIQDVSFELEGVIETFLKFGDIQVQSAGATTKFEFDQIPNPEKIKEEIMRLSTIYAGHVPNPINTAAQNTQNPV